MLDIKISVEEGIERFELEGDGRDIMTEVTFVVGQDSPVWKKDGALPGTVIVMPRIKKEES